jgi:hypothetical protein
MQVRSIPEFQSRILHPGSRFCVSDPGFCVPDPGFCVPDPGHIVPVLVTKSRTCLHVCFEGMSVHWIYELCMHLVMHDTTVKTCFHHLNQSTTPVYMCQSRQVCACIYTHVHTQTFIYMRILFIQILAVRDSDWDFYSTTPWQADTETNQVTFIMNSKLLWTTKPFKQGTDLSTLSPCKRIWYA